MSLPTQVSFNVIIGLYGKQYDGVTIIDGAYTYCYRLNHIKRWLRQQGRTGDQVTDAVAIEYHGYVS